MVCQLWMTAWARISLHTKRNTTFSISISSVISLTVCLYAHNFFFSISGIVLIIIGYIMHNIGTHRQKRQKTKENREGQVAE